MYDTVSQLFDDFLQTYFDEYYDLSDVERIRIDPKYDPVNLKLDELRKIS